ncbi:MAG: glycoside hydrolase, partial [Tannerellaceae bacterium]|nr:glycoside hydrolase [Tannerellaceae bacterium]
MKVRYFAFFCLFLSLSLTAQIRLNGYKQAEINPALFEGRWQARWISLPEEPVNVYGVYHFRKSFELNEIPAKFVVHVSADNRYKLYLNGRFVSLGPARCDVYNWNFETVDLAPFLKKGKNTLASVVWNYAERKPVAQISFNQTGFILQGNTQAEAVVNTNNTWLCLKNEAYQVWDDWKVLGYYAAGPGEWVNMAAYPWGWETSGYDDSHWKNARSGAEGAMKGARDYSGRLLVPNPIPPMEMTDERLVAVVASEGLACPKDFPKRSVPVEIPPHSSVRLLLDNQQLTTGYLSLLFSKGKDAEVRIGYAEALYEDNSLATTKSYRLNAKNHRDDIKGKLFIGYEDKLIADGGEGHSFTSLWWRTWRYLELRITTAEEALQLDDIYGTFSAYPFKNEYAFSAPGHPELSKMLDIGWRTARLCANETYMDCPYYEQLQYFGDTRIQAMISLFNTRDPYMVKHALEQGRQSIAPDGITMSRYPSGLHQFIPSFSLWWIGMGHDYWMYRGDEAYLKSLLPAYRGVLAWFERLLKRDYSLDYVPEWFFADWSAGFPNGEPVREKEGNSAFQDLIYILALDAASEMEEAFGMPSLSQHYRNLAGRIRDSIRSKYWDESRGLFADTHDHRAYSQHVNALVVLAGILTKQEAARLMEKTLADKDIAQATIYFRYYVHQALKKAGLGDQFLDNLQIWRDQMALGLTTWAEMPEPSRSDCHAWGASPNIEFYRILLGIDSEAPGFKNIRIAPSLGELKNDSGTMPHPSGSITASYTLDKKGTLKAHLTLP